MQLTLEHVKRRIARQADLERGLAREAGLLLFREKRQYLRAGAKTAREVLGR